MGYTTVGRVRVLIESVLADVDSDENQFRLRTALQLLEGIEEQQVAADEALADGELDEQVRDNLRTLGYLG